VKALKSEHSGNLEEHSKELKEEENSPEGEDSNMIHESTKEMKSGVFSIQILKADPGVVILAERDEGGENYVIELPEE